MLGVRHGLDIYSIRPQELTATISVTAQNRNYNSKASSSDTVLVQKLLVGKTPRIIHQNHALYRAENKLKSAMKL